jgi:ribosomal protein S18 acetylase RimI-like enzyme
MSGGKAAALENHLLELTVRDLEIRRATVEEVDAAFEIVQEYYEAAQVLARDTREEFERSYFEDGAGIWLAWQGKTVIGCIALRAMPQLAQGGAGEVKRLYVRPEYRGRGIAAALHDALQAYAMKFGYQWLYLDTADNMTSAIRFYEAHGYERCRRYNDNPQATIYMRKELQAAYGKAKA